MKVFTIEKKFVTEEKTSVLPFRNKFLDYFFSYTYSDHEYRPLKSNNEFTDKLSDSIEMFETLEEAKKKLNEIIDNTETKYYYYEI